jgi:hypothetical protein
MMKRKNIALADALRRPRLTPDGFVPGEVVARKAGDDASARFTPSSYNAKKAHG